MKMRPIVRSREVEKGLPDMYKESKLFSHNHPAQKSVEEIPDPTLEDIEPEEGDRPVDSMTKVDKSSEATDILKSFMGKVAPPTKAIQKAEPDITGKYEGKFKVPIKKMIGMLNQILMAEYAQWMRYYHYSLVLRGHCRDALAEEFAAHAEEELGHADKIAMRVIGLGGYPIPRMDDQPSPLKKAEEIIKELLFREQKGMELYRQVHAQCGGNEGTRQVLEENMTLEQEHIDDLWRLLNHSDEIGKADMSSGRDTMKPEKQKMAEYDHSFARTPEGIGGSPTPDLPDRGRDWHGTVPGVKDEPQGDDDEDEKEMAEAQGYFRDPKDLLASKGVAHEAHTDEAMKALAGAAQFSSGPFMAPREREFMAQEGYTQEEIDAGAQLTPRLRAQFNQEAAKQVAKSLLAFTPSGRR